MKRSQERILTTHVGSLIRPAELLEQSAQMANGTGDAATYEQCLRDSVADVVRQQAASGVDVVNDGEFGKSSWAAYVLERMDGFEIRRDQLQPLNWLGRDRERFRDFFAQEMPGALTGGPSEVCVGPITYTGHQEVQRDLDHLKAGLDGVDVEEAFFTTVAPASTAYNGVNEYYGSEEEYVYAIAEALREEYMAIYNAGFIVQVDDAVLANMYDYLAEQSEETFHRWAALRIEALNHALRDIPEDRVRYHICFGSWHVPHVADAPMSAMIEHILNVNAGAYAFEAGNVRHEHEIDAWQQAKIPDGKILIPGVVTHHTTTVEHPELVAKRLVDFANIAGRENVMGGTDCGFAQSQGTQRVHPSIVWAKFQSMAEGAQLATRRLWS